MFYLIRGLPGAHKKYREKDGGGSDKGEKEEESLIEPGETERHFHHKSHLDCCQDMYPEVSGCHKL